jgi:hypothetical protein
MATVGPPPRCRLLHELIAVLRDQGLGDFRMHDPSWCRSADAQR